MENELLDLSSFMSNMEGEVKKLYEKSNNEQLEQKDIDYLLNLLNNIDQKIINLDNKK
jgi:hypothetical protein